jgi:indole-3-glycerol phosphate synthase
MTILDKIIADKKKEVQARKELFPTSKLAESIHYNRETLSLKSRLKESAVPGIIAEFKRKSPSKGIINDRAEVHIVTRAYQEAGAAGISILTDQPYFGGMMSDLSLARNFCTIPLLRKEFIVDEYQLHEARAIGADVILLIAAALTPVETRTLAQAAKKLGLEVLLELHDTSELRHMNEHVDMVGINNRDLRDFSVDIERSVGMANHLPRDIAKISESGIRSVKEIEYLSSAGFDGFLVGENFMSTANPGASCRQFIQEINRP